MSYSQTVARENSAEQLEPTRYHLQGYDTEITYETTSFTGEPRFNFVNSVENRQFSGDEIQVEDTGVGRIVTVMLKNNAADEGFESVSLLVPVVQLTGEQQTVPIQTLALGKRLFIFVAPGARQLETYNSICLSGTAELVVF